MPLSTWQMALGSASDLIGIAVEISNWSKAREAVSQLNDGEYYRGLMRDAMPAILQDLVEYAESITHKETGTLAGAHIWDYDSHTMKGRIFIDPTRVKYSGHAVIWSNGVVTASKAQWASQYGFYEHERGGDHAFYERTQRERAPEVLLAGMKGIVFQLPR